MWKRSAAACSLVLDMMTDGLECCAGSHCVDDAEYTLKSDLDESRSSRESDRQHLDISTFHHPTALTLITDL